MKIITKMSLFFTLLTNIYATSYVLVEEGVSLSLPTSKIVVFNGTPVEVLSTNGDNIKVAMKGFMNPSDEKSLYATNNLKLLLAQVPEGNFIKKTGNQGSLEIEMNKKYLVESADTAWEKSADRFYEKCTKCHAAKVVKEHTMLEWEGLYESMKEFAKPTDDDSANVLRYLRAYAKDGILGEGK